MSDLDPSQHVQFETHFYYVFKESEIKLNLTDLGVSCQKILNETQSGTLYTILTCDPETNKTNIALA